MSTRTERDAVDRSDDVGDVASMAAKTDRAARLKHAMDHRGVSNNELDRQANVGGGWTSRFLRSKKERPGPDTIHKICTALRIREEWLLHGKGPRDIDETEPSVDGSAAASLGVGEPPSVTKAPRRTGIPMYSFHDDINAVVRLARNRKVWSLPVLALADEMIRENPIAPEELEAMLNRLENELQRVKSAHMKPG